jgi:hypothetical protein
MNPTQLGPIAALNPLTDDAAERLEIGAAEDDMLARILTSADGPEVAPARSRATRRPRRVLAVAGLAAVALPVIAVLALVPTGRQTQLQHLSPPPALGSGALKRFADASPRVLLKQPGWHVWRADEMSRLWGELDFKHAGSPTGGGLSWFPATDTRGYLQDRGSEASIKTTVPLLGTTAHVFQAKGPRVRGTYGFTAIWRMGSRGLMFEGGARNVSAFRAVLGHLRVVDYPTWLRALPASVVKTADRGETIRKMLKGIPLPPGFNASQIPGATLVRDRYQLGAAVTGTVACEWFARWGHARNAANHTAVNQAIAAMATAVHWPVLKQMSHSGDWPSVLIGYARAMRSGRWYGRPLLGDVNSGLGCSGQWHIKLPGAKPLGGLKPVKPGA